jgi:hypothetical protein
MSVLKFPVQAVMLMPADGGWLVTVGDYGWLFGSSLPAEADARWLSRNHNLPIRVIGVSS